MPSLQLVAGKNLTNDEVRQVEQTIKTLKLNDSTSIGVRLSWLRPYLQKRYDIEHLETMAPFLAGELKRQGLVDIKHPMWDEFRNPRIGSY